MVLRPTDIPARKRPPVLNDEADWDKFESSAYVDQNYRERRTDDTQIIHIARDFFTDHFKRYPGPLVRGIDVGSGANLYPALTLLPWCDTIDLFERSATNTAWLKQQVPAYESNWDSFWNVLSEAEPYSAINDPRTRISKAVGVTQGNLFDLPRASWSIGTMFFVAESLSTEPDEFHGAVECFARALEPGSPYVAAFMEGSTGYSVGGEHFPACSVDEADVRKALASHTDGEVQIARVGIPDAPLRHGYEGMLVACGRRNSK